MEAAIAEEREKVQAAERERDERIAKTPPFVDLGDTVNFTDENGWKQGIWKIRVEGLDEFEITPFGASEALQLDGKVREIRQYYNDTLHGIYKSYDMFNNFRMCVKGKYIMGKKDGLWEYPCIREDSTFESVYDIEW